FDIYEVGFNTTGVIGIENTGTVNPLKFSLSQNYPNPFNPSTVINYNLPKAGNIKLNIYNSLGESVAELVNSSQSAGTHQIEWNAVNFASGVYFYRLETEDLTSEKKMILIK